MEQKIVILDLQAQRIWLLVSIVSVSQTSVFSWLGKRDEYACIILDGCLFQNTSDGLVFGGRTASGAKFTIMVLAPLSDHAASQS